MKFKFAAYHETLSSKSKYWFGWLGIRIMFSQWACKFNEPCWCSKSRHHHQLSTYILGNIL